ncbi:trypsin-like peptidase domain-containing protein [Candidatus Woesearchaeota archaeon]|nr:trypsin-like peptidase domain-containing protein [Candidatus Woesearchaeota archaeon]
MMINSNTELSDRILALSTAFRDNLDPAINQEISYTGLLSNLLMYVPGKTELSDGRVLIKPENLMMGLFLPGGFVVTAYHGIKPNKASLDELAEDIRKGRKDKKEVLDQLKQYAFIDISGAISRIDPTEVYADESLDIAVVGLYNRFGARRFLVDSSVENGDKIASLSFNKEWLARDGSKDMRNPNLYHMMGTVLDPKEYPGGDKYPSDTHFIFSGQKARGYSGSPVIKNGKLVGMRVSHQESKAEITAINVVRIAKVAEFVDTVVYSLARSYLRTQGLK